MKTYSMDAIRNIAVMGHGKCGKTTLTEAMLFNAKMTDRMGKVADGNTVTDYDGEEIKRQFSISTALATVEWKDMKYIPFPQPAGAVYLPADGSDRNFAGRVPGLYFQMVYRNICNIYGSRASARISSGVIAVRVYKIKNNAILQF